MKGKIHWLVVFLLVAGFFISCAPKKKECEHTHGMQMETEQPAQQEVQYTCPMHAEVVSDKPEKCPKCGMNLEKKK
ncbi:hypothetical protein AUJ95_05295 [Candidatus Desantisbacteria bacterium CG2_30_40_21]|uniref:Heavy metal binding domain-containing protein n=5 Tax=unclassified Candidatus Desantisiibacteriota TaxID=3106372 RepID=A0A2M7JDT6_9BACT|nr:MAG: hypothetical protein AUJ95_05295 [Candidatus Desantisbacteria bacterium CG2_30_40_21]PIP42404.1 MAG: hypothetical protein COX18_00455 [Candidatus Desantisbacteria bacterium CG23_combo_of_CG06-09_8_20_14_all_40_23]PIX17533.1 MAG: hypothetical protein COZ71_02810 [Candidatus Desantisbacteria bacterium CG_4_8_14_3_um_filter_40_12]PIY18763.1 MAG: hypothetical protein COZ13_08845 [Candidatus Desantisbacteria bacterium CG_4_10_14_3_um_filter_40_18]PJB28351.1 MAG: hypothetical protein CO110_09